MPPRTKSRKRSHRQTDPFGTVIERTNAPRTTATDVCFWMTFLGTTVCFGGRTAVGQLIFVVGTAITVSCWLLQQLASRESRRTWTGSEWLWLMGIAIGVAQIAPLPPDWLSAISPRIGHVLMPPGAGALRTDVWNQLSFAPWETASGLATFVSYALMFLVISQRLHSLVDIERMMFIAGMITVAMAIFAEAQYFGSNGKFYWIYAHPYMTTDRSPHGCFTNHNHLAQFLALGIGPLVWCVLRRLEPADSERANSETRPVDRSLTIAISLGLCCTVLTSLSTLSRGGLLATAVAIAICVGALWWLGRISAELCLGLVVVVAGIGAVFNLSGNEAALSARVETESGRIHIWQANFAVAQDFPILGTGVGTHADAHQLRLEHPLEGHEYTHAESSFLQVMSETGFAGFGLAIMFILVSLWWCCGALRNPDPRVSAIAVAVLASLLANVAHAAVDFFWYTPSCMLLLAIQLAGVCRLYKMTRAGTGVRGQESGVRNQTLESESAIHGGTGRVRQMLSLATLGGVLTAAAWMVSVKLPAALAEQDRMRYITLSLAGPTFYADDEDYKQAQHEKRQAAIRASRLNPHDSNLQETAALAYLEWFNERQEQSENSMPLAQLRDAVRASEFESPKAAQEWLDKAVGKNVKLLRIAAKHLRLALQECPLRAQAYVELAELCFLDAAGKTTEMAYLKQAVALRPHDADILFAVGRDVLLNENVDAAMPYWRDAIQYNSRIRNEVTKILVQHVTSDYFMTNLNPDWLALAHVAQAFDQAGRKGEAKPVWQKCIEGGTTRLKSKLSTSEREQTFLAIREAFTAIDEPDRAISILMTGHKQMSNSLVIRTQLAWDLYKAGRFSEAAEHLQWCSARNPDDKVLQQAAATATKERLRTVAVDQNANPS